MLGITLLEEIIRKTEIKDAASVLNELRTQIKIALAQSGNSKTQQDGMDIAFCDIDTTNLEMSFAGAYNPCWIIRKNMQTTDNEFIILDADHQPVGIFHKEKPFVEKKILLQQDDIIYIFSDGYESQFGGERNEKFKMKRFRELIINNSILPLTEQEEILLQQLNHWKNNNEQTDDILILSFKI